MSNETNATNNSNITIDEGMPAAAVTAITKDTKLSEVLGVDLDPVDAGYLALKKFAEEHADEVVFSEEGPAITFSVDDMTFKVRADTDEDFSTVYQATATTYFPTTTVFESDYVGSIDEAIFALAEFCQNDFVEAANDDYSESSDDADEEGDKDVSDEDADADDPEADARTAEEGADKTVSYFKKAVKK